MNAAPQRSFARRNWPTLVVAGAVLAGGGYILKEAVQVARTAARRMNDR
jgi:hypothetical protein